MRELTYRKGFIKLWRLGDLNFRKQKVYRHITPTSKGLWAFPYPYFEKYFAYHKYIEAMPKNGHDGSEEDFDKWIQEKGKKAVRLTEFWYQGDIYTRLFSDYSAAAWGEQWNKVSTEELYKMIKRIRGNSGIQRIDGKQHTYTYTSDHLELFIAPNNGIIKTSKNP